MNDLMRAEKAEQALKRIVTYERDHRPEIISWAKLYHEVEDIARAALAAHESPKKQA